MAAVQLFGYGIRSGTSHLQDGTVVTYKVNGSMCADPVYANESPEDSERASIWDEIGRYTRVQLTRDHPDHPAVGLSLAEFVEWLVPPTDFVSVEEMEGVGKGDVGMMNTASPLDEPSS